MILTQTLHGNEKKIWDYTTSSPSRAILILKLYSRPTPVRSST